MELIERRDCMVKLLGSFAVLAIGPVVLTAESEDTKMKPSAGDREFWKHIDSVKARKLVESSLNAARAQVESQRAINSSLRVSILLGSGEEYAKRAEVYYKTRTAELQKAREALAEFVQVMGKSGEGLFQEFIRKDGLKTLANQARQSALQALANSEISADEAREAKKALDEQWDKIQGLSSFHEASSYLDQHFGELIDRKMAKEDPNGLCLLILIITSLYAMLVIMAILACLFGCSAADTLNRWLVQLCGG